MAGKMKDKSEIPSLEEKFLARNYSSIESFITVVIRDFEHYDNDVVETVKSLLKTVPALKVIIVSNALIYPPLQWKYFNHSSVKVINLKLEVGGYKEDRDLLHHVQTKYIFFVPDSVRPITRNSFITLLKGLEEPNVHILAAPVSEVRL